MALVFHHPANLLESTSIALEVTAMSDRVRFYEALEILNSSGGKTGRFRVATWVDGESPVGLCKHHHRSPQEACDCPDASAIIDREFAPRYGQQ